MLKGLKGRKSLGKILFLAALVVASTFAQGIFTNAEAGWISGVSRASTAGFCLQAKESITFDAGMPVANRWRWADSQHWNAENGKWVYKHLTRSGWQWGWRAGNLVAHYWGTDNFAYPGVVGDHWTYFPDSRGVVYHGRTTTVNACGNIMVFMFDNVGW